MFTLLGMSATAMMAAPMVVEKSQETFNVLMLFLTVIQVILGLR